MQRIFKKLLLTYVGIVALALFTLSLLLFQFLQAHLFQEKQDALLDTARYINTLLTEYRRGSMGEDELEQAVNMIGETTNSRILIIDGIDPSDDTVPVSDIPGLKEEDITDGLGQILKGEVLLSRRLYSRELDVYVVAVGLPLKDTRQQTRGAVILFSPVYPLERALQKAKGIIALTALASLFLGTGIIYYIAKKMSDPIVHVSRAAVAMARGEKPPDIPAGPRDEVGQLILSFNHMKNQLEKMERVRREFLTGISHELRTPLTAIRGFVQGIVDGVIPAMEEKRYLQLTLKEANRLSSLIDDLLELGRLEAGGVNLSSSWINLTKVMGEVTDFMARQAAAKRVTLGFEAPEEVNLWADGDRLKQVGWNLLSNAVTYTPSGGCVRVKLCQNLKEVLLEVEDTGIGIPQEDLPHICSMFYRVDQSRDPATGGTGLGLAIAKNIVELHQGTITIASHPGEGTRVTVRIPIHTPGC